MHPKHKAIEAILNLVELSEQDKVTFKDKAGYFADHALDRVEARGTEFEYIIACAEAAKVLLQYRRRPATLYRWQQLFAALREETNEANIEAIVQAMDDEEYS